MDVAFLEAYYGGSHRAFADGWARRSRHQVRVSGLPARKWKWRMQTAAWVFAERLLAAHAPPPDVVFTTDMLNLAELRGLLHSGIAESAAAAELFARTPFVLYFHENQYSYPAQVDGRPDYDWGAANCASALAADLLVFNSAFHRRDFFKCWRRGNRQMPDERLDEARINALEASARVIPVGVDLGALDRAAPGGSGADTDREGRTLPPLILWNHRWEHDKQPEDLFDALRRVRAAGGRFRLAVCGEVFPESPACFEAARSEFADEIEVFGFLPSREDYARLLWRADIVVSTAAQEFLGLSVIEAMWCGCRPLLPRRLNYPNLLPEEWREACLYEDVSDLAAKLQQLTGMYSGGEAEGSADAAWPARQRFLVDYGWEGVSRELDDLVEEVARGRPQ